MLLNWEKNVYFSHGKRQKGGRRRAYFIHYIIFYLFVVYFELTYIDESDKISSMDSCRQTNKKGTWRLEKKFAIKVLR